jgi:hypothetical protein
VNLSFKSSSSTSSAPLPTTHGSSRPRDELLLSGNIVAASLQLVFTDKKSMLIPINSAASNAFSYIDSEGKEVQIAQNAIRLGL